MLKAEEYARRVYAGVLGKCIGVYLGRPLEGWTYDRIRKRYGTVEGYVSRAPERPLVVTDDDIAGTFVFPRALADSGCDPAITSDRIAEGWLNYLIEGRTTLWWGGRGNSTEHTAYLNLVEGVPPPRSGSEELNGPVLAQGVGAQIFIDGWAMVAPGDPERAVDLAVRAAAVTHDGEALHGARVIAAVESLAFVESRISSLLDAAMIFIPRQSLVYRMIEDLRGWHASEADWRKTREKLDECYGYRKFEGNCPLIPNLGVILLGLLYGKDDFGKTLSVVNTAGWDTDCNSGNAGCIMGIKNGLEGIDGAYDWRGPVRDRLYVTSADAGGVVSDAVTESYRLVNMGLRMAGRKTLFPKGGARFHFEMPGSVQGFSVQDSPETTAAEGGTDPARVDNAAGHSRRGTRSLRLSPGSGPACFTTATFVPREDLSMPVYELMASPTLYPGQTVRAALEADEGNTVPVRIRLVIGTWTVENELRMRHGAPSELAPGVHRELKWRIPPETVGPVARVGVEIDRDASESFIPMDAPPQVAYLDCLRWDGRPECRLFDETRCSAMGRNAWVRDVDFVPIRMPFRMVQNRGRGTMIQGSRDWKDYRLSARLSFQVVREAGIGLYVQGMRRYYVFGLSRERGLFLERGPDVLAEAPHGGSYAGEHTFSMAVKAGRIRTWLDERPVFDRTDRDPLDGGAVSVICTEGCVRIHEISVKPFSGGVESA